ncbi:AAA family ATPase [Paraliomyxa miuraensis]|uniref:AAA family ATPase n=1 Tax=Paraliomyxa miuraensis TaxID=376150 RepID=UPI00225632A9|nr:ATP-binding protein [Paraliomyxa miuraensis]MCX4239787.1 ATP-binding protein [Paraliomyxa miuraensis]
MAEHVENPYRHDAPGVGPFVGRRVELTKLRRSVEAGRNALAAVMGGRGMGKTALATRLLSALEGDEQFVVRSIARVGRDTGAFVRQLEDALDAPIDPGVLVQALVRAVKARRGRRLVLLLDEVDGLVDSDDGRDVLENLRIAYEQLHGALAIVVFGGIRLRELLTSNVSPFLRSAQWFPLVGLSLEDTAALIREPLRLEVPRDLVEVLWEQTGGHPLLLQAIMERAVDLGSSTSTPVVDHLLAAMTTVVVEMLEPKIFPIWWDNLTARGQQGYRTLLAMDRPLEREQWAIHLGSGPDDVVEVLESTGIARVEGGRLLARSATFGAWVNRCHPMSESSSLASPPSERNEWLRPGVDAFEQLVVEKVARWARSIVEHPAPFLRGKAKAGGDGLGLEQSFQLGLLHALRQHDLLVEPEPLSAARGRVDLKVRPRDDSDQRACVEIKIWGRKHKDVLEQVLGYVVPGDDFACIVMIDRHERPLRDAYLQECLSELPEPLWQDAARPPAHPAIVTEHRLASGGTVRVYHFLVQLPL